MLTRQMIHLLCSRYRENKALSISSPPNKISFGQIDIRVQGVEMGDAYWNRQPQQQQQQLPPQSAGLLKRPRSEYVPDLPPSGMSQAHEMHHYLGRDDDRGGPRVVDTQSIGSAYDRGGPRVVDTQSIGSAYDRYLQSSQLSSLSVGDANNYKGVGLARAGGGGIPALPVRDPLPSARGPELAPNGRPMVFSGQMPVESMPRPRETLPLPPDASNTLYIEGLPSDSSRREVAHIFRPFVGYKEVRLVRKESKHRGGDPLILCFVDFVDPACAATALSALQGYKMDEHDPDSAYLRLQFSKFPGPRSGGSGSRGKR
ncbi:RNA-binding protein 2-like isoform X1 [Lycium ferocissimum]|uniref:RNA-binding protein 2-like isoform X1 n=2 Tax=Lycium ferocissimum TaxID=112874 RepID=UPI002815FCF2|nr:RNA-binding protein 2-like isoform X1 [Lycium ferocissimum]